MAAPDENAAPRAAPPITPAAEATVTAAAATPEGLWVVVDGALHLYTDTLAPAEWSGLTGTVTAMQGGLRKRGVDLMSHMSGVTSMAHTDADIDETLEAFEDTVQEMIGAGHIGGA